MLPINTQSSLLHLSLFYLQPSARIPQRDHSLPSVGEATRRIGNEGVHLPFLPTHHLRPDPHEGVMVGMTLHLWGAGWAPTTGEVQET